MLKKVCCGGNRPISLLLAPCLSVVGLTLLLLLLVTITEFFRSGFCEKKFLPLHFLNAYDGLNEKGFLCPTKISLVCFLDLIVPAAWLLNIFTNRYSSYFCRNDAFFLTLILPDIGNS